MTTNKPQTTPTQTASATPNPATDPNTPDTPDAAATEPPQHPTTNPDAATPDAPPLDAETLTRQLAATRKEAANYRTRVKTAETIANTLRTQLINLKLETHGITLEALTAAGINPETLHDPETGQISDTAIKDAAALAVEKLGAAIKRRPGSADGGSGHAYRTPAATSPTWGNLFNN